MLIYPRTYRGVFMQSKQIKFKRNGRTVIRWEHTKACTLCNEEYITIRSAQKICPKCKTMASETKFHTGNTSATRILPKSIELPTGTVGAIGELIASADLLSKGFEVFKAVSMHATSDLIIRKDNRYYSVEVKAGKLNDNKGLVFSRPKYNKDLLAIVLPNKLIQYRPSLENL